MSTRWRRRRLLRAGATLGVASLAGCSGMLGESGPVSGDGWPSYQRGPGNTGANPAAAGPGQELNERWATTAESLAADVTEDARVPMVSPPAVVDGTVYAALVSPAWEEGVHLVALDAVDGSLQWRTKAMDRYGKPGTGPLAPTVVDGTVVVANPGLASSSPVAAVDVESREVTWRDDVERYTVTSGTPWEGTLVFGEATAWALEADGNFAWRSAEGERTRRARGDQPPTITADGAYVPTLTHLYAVDHEGERRWERSLRFENETLQTTTQPYTPVATDDAVYVVTGALRDRGDGRLLALNPADGSTRWEFKPEFDASRRERLVREAYEESRQVPALGVGVYATPALSGGTLYALGMTLPEDDAERGSVPTLFAIDAGSGERQWATELPDTFGVTPPAIAGDVVYVPTAAGLVAVDAGSGDLLTTGTANDAFIDGLAIVGDAAYLSDRGSLVALGP